MGEWVTEVSEEGRGEERRRERDERRGGREGRSVEGLRVMGWGTAVNQGQVPWLRRTTHTADSALSSLSLYRHSVNHPLSVHLSVCTHTRFCVCLSLTISMSVSVFVLL